MIRVAVIAPHFPEYSLRYSAAMARRCDVLVCLDEGQLDTEYHGRPIESGCATLKRMRFKTPHDLWRLVAAIWQFRPDVIHVQEAVGPRRAFFTACVAWAMRRQSVIVLTVHDPVPHSGRDQLAARHTGWIGSYLRRHAHIIVAHGAFCASLLRAELVRPWQRLVTSEHGVILEPSEHHPAPGGAPRLYVFGRMEAYKGIEVLLRTAEILHAEDFPFKLLIAGRGPELDRLRDRFALLPEVTVRSGFVPPNEVIASIQASDCVVLPYLEATQSGVLAAAFGGRRYVIASDTGGLPDVVAHDQNGLLVPPGDAVALADAIRLLARDSVRRARLLAGAEATARGQLAWDRIAGAMADVFEEALRR